jgi:glutamate-ammonia-ligase adenylyltransferase
LLEARPQLAAAVAQILAHAPALADQLARRPTLLDGLIDDSRASRSAARRRELAAQFRKAMRGEPLDVALDRCGGWSASGASRSASS